MDHRLLGMILLGGLLALAGCGDDGTTDSGVRIDSGGIDSGPPPEDGGTGDAGGGERSWESLLMNVPVAQVGNYDVGAPGEFVATGPADFSCMGTVTQPTPGAAATFTLTVEDFQDEFTVEGVCVKFYPDNVVPAMDTCEGLMSDADGHLSVMGFEDGWYAYRIFPKMGPTDSLTVVGSVQFNEPSPADGGSATINSVSQATINLIPTTFAFRRVPGTSLVGGAFRDCNDDNVHGMILRFARMDGTYILEGSRGDDPHYRYFDGDEFPSADQLYSHADGLYAVANVPVGTDGEPIFVEAWGRLSDGADPVLLGCEQARLYADTVTILNVGPLRSDGPACPALSGM